MEQIMTGWLSPVQGLTGTLSDHGELTGHLSSAQGLSGTLSERGTLTGWLLPVSGLSGTLSPPQTLTGQLTVPTAVGVDIYGGPYEVTPGEQAQRVPVGDKVMREDIIVEAIPQNYGRLSWDGRTLTVY